MNSDDPIAYFITWTVYGTHLQGDARGWKQRRKGNQPARLRLAEWHHDRLKHAVLLLTEGQRTTVEHECMKHCDHREWHLWAVNARTNHVHAVVTAKSCAGQVVREQLKANCTRGLREQWNEFRERPVWTVGGDWQCINSEDDLESAILYVTEAQDRKGS